MKLTNIIGISLIALLTLSCIRKEAPNAEADIIGCYLPDNVLATDSINVNLPYEESIDAYPIYIEVKQGTDRTELAPTFTLTPGASIIPASGSVHDFTAPVRYTVTSEDGKWQRVYSINVREESITEIPTEYHFENVRLNDSYYIFYETDNDHTLTWASGNPGFKLSSGNSDALNYPTTIEKNGYMGQCVKLVTKTTGSLGAMVNMPIASGNLFIGQFNIANALSNPLTATLFGTTYYKKPLKITGYYKYQSGPRFYENGNYTDKKDQFDIYAIFYENHDEQNKPITLDGTLPTENFQHPQMVALARINDHSERDEWTYFEIEFDYQRYGKEIDYAKLYTGGYNFALVMASSINGATFEGAPESTLWIDEISIINEE